MLRIVAARANFPKRFLSSSSPSNPSSSPTNWPLIVGGLAAVGGVGYYFSQSRPAKESNQRSVAIEGHLKEAGQLSKDGIERHAKDGYYDTKAAAQSSLDSAEAKAQRSYDSLKASATETASDAQRRYDQLRSSVLHEAEKKTDEAKAGWFSWLGFGKTKARESKEAAANKVAKGAEDVKKSAEKHS